MVRLLVLAIILASVFPATGATREVAQDVSSAAIFVLFFLNGLRLPRAEVVRGIGHWRFLVPLALWCFLVMALAGKAFELALAPAVSPLVALGFLYLGAMPSTVQSATAYSSLAGGNVASSVVAAALLALSAIGWVAWTEFAATTPPSISLTPLVEDARKEGVKIYVLCPFVNAERKKPPDWADVFQN